MTGGALRPSFGLSPPLCFTLTVCDTISLGLLALITLWLSYCQEESAEIFSLEKHLSPSHPSLFLLKKQTGILHKQTPTHTVTHTHIHTLKTNTQTPPCSPPTVTTFRGTGQRVQRLLQFKTRGREVEKVEETRRQFNPGWLEVDVVCESAGGNLMHVNGSLLPHVRC